MILPETPGVYCDVNIGTFVAEDLEFDQGLAQEIMRSRGVSDAAISELTFNFAYHNPEPTDVKKPDLVTHGSYVHPSRLVNTYLESYYRIATRVSDKALSGIVQEFADEQSVSPEELLEGSFALVMDEEKTRIVNNIVNRQANSALLHEIDHVVEFNTLEENEVIKRHIAYRERLWTAQQNKIGALLLVAFACLVAPEVESYENVPPHIIGKALIPELLVAGGSVFIATRMQRRRPYDPMTHKEYLQSPWEVEARRFAAESIEEVGPDFYNSKFPLRIACKPQRFQFVTQ
ncbi:MAG TPA: hypothetical protein VNG32_00945 [Candidatus Dormibacteraeota bacterium]|nr:hypothetical protein [Candidatus Dormibacteraeota bacterium]